MSQNTTQHLLTSTPQTPSPSGEGLEMQERQTQPTPEEAQPDQGATIKQPPAITNPERLQPINALELFEHFTDIATSIKDASTYLEFRSQLLDTLKRCQRSLEIHEARTFIPLLAEMKTDTMRFGKYEVSYKPSSKRAIDMKKLQAAVSNWEILELLFKPKEFKPLHQCREILFKNGVYSDVYTTKIGKKPILHIIDANTIKKELEPQEVEETEEENS